MTRAERAPVAQRLRDEGLLLREIAERMGISRSYVHGLISDPQGLIDRARKDSYRGTCSECGRPTDGSNGSANAPKRCGECLQREQHLEAVDRALAGIRLFAKRYGRPPSAADFNPATARARGETWRVERFYRDGDYPALSGVQRLFGSWAAGVRAAGFNGWAPGYYGRAGEDPEVIAETVWLYLDRPDLNVAEIAERLGVHASAVWRRLESAGVPCNRRPGRKVAA